MKCSEKTREGVQDIFVYAARLLLNKRSCRKSNRICVLHCVRLYFWPYCQICRYFSDVTFYSFKNQSAEWNFFWFVSSRSKQMHELIFDGISQVHGRFLWSFYHGSPADKILVIVKFSSINYRSSYCSSIWWIHFYSSRQINFYYSSWSS